MKRLRQAALRLLLLAIVSSPGCTQPWKTSRLTTPSDHVIVRDQLVVHSDFPLAAHHRLLEELTARRRDLSLRLGLPAEGEPVHVFLFEDADRFGQFMRQYYPQFPQRRAFFVQTDTRLEVYAQWGDRVAEDLRHEITHAYLHSVVPNLPLWLDEGLAEYFEVPRGHSGRNDAHLDNLLARLERRQWSPDIQRMERLDQPFGMTLDDYAESWAWVHFLLDGPPQQRQLLRDYLAELRQIGSARPLGLRLRQSVAEPEVAVVEHIRHLAAPVQSAVVSGNSTP